MPFSNRNLTDYQRFAIAQRCVETEDHAAEGIAVMIHLSWSAVPTQLRAWAANFLQERLNTSIEGTDCEAEREADRIS